MVRAGRRGSYCAPGRRQGATGSQLRQVWKNNGSAVETEPRGDTWATGDQKTRNINGLARAALEREREIRAYRAEAADHGRFPGVHAERHPWRRERGSGGEDSVENRAMLLRTGAVPRRTFPSYTVLHAASLSYKPVTKRLQSTYSSPDRVIAATGCPDGETDADATGMHGDVVAGQDVRTMPVGSAVTAVACTGAGTSTAGRAPRRTEASAARHRTLRRKPRNRVARIRRTRRGRSEARPVVACNASTV